MSEMLTRPFVRLVSTSPAIERLPLIRRPRTMAAAWGGLLVCKLAAMVLLSPSEGALLLGVTLLAGIAATYARFGGNGEETFHEGVAASPA